jgi:hypothetical protein
MSSNLNFIEYLFSLFFAHKIFYMYLYKDDERFKEAEEEFVKANKPKEAIDMYVHQQVKINAEYVNVHADI